MIDEDWRVIELYSSPEKQSGRRRVVGDVTAGVGGNGVASRGSRPIKRFKDRARTKRRFVRYALCIGLAGLVTLRPNDAIAEEPPWTVPKYVLPARGGDAI